MEKIGKRTGKMNDVMIYKSQPERKEIFAREKTVQENIKTGGTKGAQTHRKLEIK